MDKEFNTTFIPKQAPVKHQLSRSPKKPVGAITALAVSLFVAAVTSLVGVYLYEKVLLGEIRQKKVFIADTVAQLDQEFLLELKALDSRLQISQDLLDNHRTVSSVLKELERLTIPALSFGSFDFSVSGDPDSPAPDFSLDGTAVSFRSLAQQEKLYAQSDLFTQVVFSDFALSEENFVSFTLEVELDEEVRRYLYETENLPEVENNSQGSPFDRKVNSLENQNDTKDNQGKEVVPSSATEEPAPTSTVGEGDQQSQPEVEASEQVEPEENSEPEEVTQGNMEEELLESSGSTDSNSL